MRVWDAATAAAPRRAHRHASLVNYICFSPDGRQAASGALEGPVFVWDAGTGLELFRPQGEMEIVWHLGYSADGRLLAGAAAPGHAVRVWDAATGECVDLRHEGAGRALRPYPSTLAPSRWRVAKIGFDTVVQDAAAGLAVAAFPTTPAEGFTTGPHGRPWAWAGRTWAWGVAEHVYLVTLEGPYAFAEQGT